MAKPRLLNMCGKIVPYEDARVHVLSTAMKYAASVYEAMRAYWSDADQQLYVFRPREHLRRLERSAKIARIPLPADAARLERETLEIIRANELREDLHVRLIVFVDTDDGGLASREPVGYVIAPIPTTRYFETAGLHVGVSSWHRTADNAIPARVKAAANYQNSRLALLQAKTDGYDDAIMLNQDGSVAEGPGYTLFLVTEDRPMTPSVTSNILEGVTRATLLTLFPESLGVSVEQREIDRTELYVADEAFFAGTAAEVTPILSIDRRPVGEGVMGPLTAKVRDAYFRAVRDGSAPHPEWRIPVYG
ncbi:MAG TPA: branched-chain amino acid transaminase [Methylomirabilota bacterium]|nr:branched-chain amino acid transaminase [Methylomirabilota bacterium]